MNNKQINTLHDRLKEKLNRPGTSVSVFINHLSFLGNWPKRIVAIYSNGEAKLDNHWKREFTKVWDDGWAAEDYQMFEEECIKELS